MLQYNMEVILFLPSTPNSVLAFCVCHLIIAILLFSSTAAAANSGRSVEMYSYVEPVQMDITEENFVKDNEEDIEVAPGEEEGHVKEDEGCYAEELVEENHQENEGDVGEWSEGELVEGNDELKKRAEEFIEKMNRVWRAESQMLRFSLKA